MQGTVGPCLDSHDSGTELSNVIGQLRAYEVVDLRKAAQRGPSRACGTVWVTIVEGGTISPDVLPVGRYALRAGKNDRGRG